MATHATGDGAPHLQPHQKLDISKFRGGADLIKNCHACHSPLWEEQGGQTKIRHRGFFACTSCPVRKNGRNSNSPAAYRRVFCIGCIEKYVPGGVDSCFEGTRQTLDKCWHCQALGDTPGDDKCRQACPKVAKMEADAATDVAQGKTKKRKAESLTPPAPKRRPLPRSITSPDFFNEQAEQLSVEVRRLGWFTPKPSNDFLFFLPEFARQRDETMRVGQMGFKDDCFFFPRAVHWLPATETDGKARLHCDCSLKLLLDGQPSTCFHIRVLELLVDFHAMKKLQPRDWGARPPTQKADAIRAKVAISGIECYAICKSDLLFVVGNHLDQWFCTCKRCSCDQMCIHACIAAGRDFAYKFQPSLFSREPKTEWGHIRAQITEPVIGKSLVEVCPGCKPPGAEAISAAEHRKNVRRCKSTHTKSDFETVHMCIQEECKRRSCVQGPGLSRTPASSWEPLKTAAQLSAEGFFCAPPPVSACAPCTSVWRRRGRQCLFLSGEVAAKVVLGEWVCEAGCHAIRPQVPGIYFSATSKLIVTHQLLHNATENLYQGHSFAITHNHYSGIARKIEDPGLRSEDVLRSWLKLYFRSEFARLPRAAPPAPPPEEKRSWTPIMRELLREVPLLPHEPTDPTSLIHAPLRRYFPHAGDEKGGGAAWWTARVVAYNPKSGEYKVKYDEDKSKDTLYWADLRHRLISPSEATTVWGRTPLIQLLLPPLSSAPVPDVPPAQEALKEVEPPVTFTDDAKPPPFCSCPKCGDFPEELYIDCRTEETLRACSSSCPGHLPVTYPALDAEVSPTMNRIKGGCVCGAPPKEKQRRRQGTDQTDNYLDKDEPPKVVKDKRARDLLRRWSAAMTEYGAGSQQMGQKVKGNEPLVLTDEKNEYKEMLGCLPKCVRALVEKVNPEKLPRCPEGPWRDLFYHLGQFSTDVDLVRKGAQDIVLQLLVALKYSVSDIEISTEWSQLLKIHAPTLNNIIQTLRGDVNNRNGHKGYELGQRSGRKREGTGYRASSSVVRMLAPLLHHLLRLSYSDGDPDAGELAVALVERALGVGRDGIWSGTKGDTLEVAEALRIIQAVRDVMSAPCRGLDEGVRCTNPALYAANQRRLSSSWAFHTIYRHVPRYRDRENPDGRTTKGEPQGKCDGAPVEKDDRSRKKIAHNLRYTNGQMRVTCKHGILYYYHILLRPESVRDVFTFLVTRFKHRLPSVIVFDNACQVARYAHGRWPELFSNTIWVTDKFHKSNHKCSKEYDYTFHFGGLEKWHNTSVVEQINKWFKRFDGLLYNCHLDTAKLIYDITYTQLNKHIAAALENGSFFREGWCWWKQGDTVPKNCTLWREANASKAKASKAKASKEKCFLDNGADLA